MAYEPEKDKVVKDFGVVKMDEGNTDSDTFQFQLVSYDRGDVKLSITKQFSTKDGIKTTSKLGRIHNELIPYFIKKLQQIEAHLKE